MPKKPEDKPAEQHPTDAIDARRSGAEKPDGSMTDAEEAKRSGPPPTGDAMPKPLADPAQAPAQAQPNEAQGAWAQDMVRRIDEILADPDFDPSGKHRETLGRLSASIPVGGQSAATGQAPNSTVTDGRGDPVVGGPTR